MKRILLLIVCFTLMGVKTLYAQKPPVAVEAATPMAILLVTIMLVLVLVIGLLAYVLLGAAEIKLQQYLSSKNSNVANRAMLLVLLISASIGASAQSATIPAAAAATANKFGGLSSLSYYTMVGIIGLQLILILAMVYFIKLLLAKNVPPVVAVKAEYKMPVWQVWWNRLNAFKAENEVGDTGHNYDGIRELDNRLPPWWLYGFFLTVVFSIVYLYRAEVSHTAPSPLQELEIAMANATAEQQAYLATAASKVDENTVTYLTGTEDIGGGKKIFALSCAPCHGAEAQGSVGPNLTDDYWVHKGSVKDIFKTIKYGVPEKGMKAWKDDFSPVQIAQLASYIKWLKGTKPPNAKEPQGDLYKDTGAADSTTANKNIASNQ